MKQHLFIYFIFCFFSILHSMEDAREVIVESSPPEKKTTIPVLPLGVTTGQTQASDRSSGSPKKQIVNLSELQRATSVKLTTRRNGANSGTTTRQTINTKRNRMNQEVPHTDSPSSPQDSPATGKTPISASSQPRKTTSLLPNAIGNRSGKILLQETEEKWYSEDDLWEKLKIFNPILYTFGEKHDMSLEQLEDFALFLQEHDIHPKVMAEHVHKANLSRTTRWWKRLSEYFFGNTDEQRFNNFLEHFDKIKKENPENWEELVLELMKTTSDEAEGFRQRSKIADVQAELLTRDNEDQAHQIRMQYVAILAQFLGTLGASAWAVYGQVGTANCNNSTT